MLNRVLVNSLPKSGTHLLEKAVKLLGYKSYMDERSLIKRIRDRAGVGSPRFLARVDAMHCESKWNLVERNVPSPEYPIAMGVFSPFYVSSNSVSNWLQSVAPGQYIKGHVPYNEVFSEKLRELNYSHLLILRDPRAVIASKIDYVLNARNLKHFLEDDFKGKSIDERFEFLLFGGTTRDKKIRSLGLSDVFGSMMEWASDDRTLIILFEDLIGGAGGGSRDQQARVVKRLSDFLKLECTPNFEAISEKIFDRGSPTFRSGKIDGWKNSLSERQLEMIEKYCEPLVVDMNKKLSA